MTSVDRCLKSIPYASRERAIGVIRKVNAKQQRFLHAIHCDQCGQWHIAPQPGTPEKVLRKRYGRKR